MYALLKNLMDSGEGHAHIYVISSMESKPRVIKLKEVKD
jgi:hypothetical protein